MSQFLIIISQSYNPDAEDENCSFRNFEKLKGISYIFDFQIGKKSGRAEVLEGLFIITFEDRYTNFVQRNSINF